MTALTDAMVAGLAAASPALSADHPLRAGSFRISRVVLDLDETPVVEDAEVPLGITLPDDAVIVGAMARSLVNVEVNADPPYPASLVWAVGEFTSYDGNGLPRLATGSGAIAPAGGFGLEPEEWGFLSTGGPVVAKDSVGAADTGWLGGQIELTIFWYLA